MDRRYKHVFVLTVGRSGSNTFAQACSHISNYSSGHETRSWEIGPSRFDYPNGHIEVDNKLSWMLGQLDEKYGDDAFYVHLNRNKAQVVESWDQRWNLSFSNIRFFTEGVLSNVPELLSDTDRLVVGAHHYDTVNANIRLFLKDKSNVLTVHLEDIENDFVRFWHEIAAEGDLDNALAEFNVRHNHTESKSSYELKERKFRLAIDEKVLRKKIREGGSLIDVLGWRLKVLGIKLKRAVS